MDFRSSLGRKSAGPQEERLVHLAELLGFEPAPFLGPLVAFDPEGERSDGDPLYLGGDLHAVHPDDARMETTKARDETLDEAVITIALGDFPGETVEAIATRGIRCVAP